MRLTSQNANYRKVKYKFYLDRTPIDSFSWHEWGGFSGITRPACTPINDRSLRQADVRDELPHWGRFPAV